MKKKIAIIITAGLLPCLSWAEGRTDNIAAIPLISDSSLDVSLRNYWKYLKEDAANPKTVHAAWTALR